MLVCSISLTDAQLVGITAGVKTKTGVACSGVLTTDILEIYPTSPATFPDGVAIHHALPTAANTVKLVYNLPAVTLLTNYNIPVAIYAVNR